MRINRVWEEWVVERFLVGERLFSLNFRKIFVVVEGREGWRELSWR